MHDRALCPASIGRSFMPLRARASTRSSVGCRCIISTEHPSRNAPRLTPLPRCPGSPRLQQGQARLQSFRHTANWVRLSATGNKADASSSNPQYTRDAPQTAGPGAAETPPADGPATPRRAAQAEVTQRYLELLRQANDRKDRKPAPAEAAALPSDTTKRSSRSLPQRFTVQPLAPRSRSVSPAEGVSVTSFESQPSNAALKAPDAQQQGAAGIAAARLPDAAATATQPGSTLRESGSVATFQPAIRPLESPDAEAVTGRSPLSAIRSYLNQVAGREDDDGGDGGGSRFPSLIELVDRPEWLENHVRAANFVVNSAVALGVATALLTWCRLLLAKRSGQASSQQASTSTQSADSKPQPPSASQPAAERSGSADGGHSAQTSAAALEPGWWRLLKKVHYINLGSSLGIQPRYALTAGSQQQHIIAFENAADAKFVASCLQSQMAAGSGGCNLIFLLNFVGEAPAVRIVLWRYIAFLEPSMCTLFKKEPLPVQT